MNKLKILAVKPAALIEKPTRSVIPPKEEAFFQAVGIVAGDASWEGNTPQCAAKRND